jgi:arylsulfatase A-like enzyme
VSRVVDALKDTDLWDNTYLVFLSDNGACFQAGGLNTPYRGTKKHLFEGALPFPRTIITFAIHSPLQIRSSDP